jgi:HAD superfamily hydrolase (TIGR01450 family)
MDIPAHAIPPGPTEGDAAPAASAALGTWLVDRYDAVLLDLDGVVYVGPDAVPGAAETIRTLLERGVRVGYLTNNAARPPATVAEHLRDLGLPARAADVVTSAEAGARLLRAGLPPGAAVLAVGGPGVADALAAAGLRAVYSADDEPVAVMQGFGRDVGWRHLAEATLALRRGIPYVATNLDLTVPTERGIAPGNGLLVEAVRRASGVEPVVAGKPEGALVEESVERLGARRPLLVGDRLDTDIAAANRYGCDSLAVLSGVSLPSDIATAEPGLRPTYVGRDLTALTEPDPGRPARSTDGSVRLGGFAAHVRNGDVELTGDGDPLAGLLAVAHACWSAADGGNAADPAPALRVLGFAE